MRPQVELLLKYHDEAGEFIESPALANAPELFVDDPDALIGQHLGCYRIDAVLGVGGMGVVYLACDERLGRKVGLKLLPRSLVNDQAQLDRLKFEARTASALNHPNIVTVHEIGHVDSTHYIAIEFIEGMTLRERITRGPVPPDEAIEIATQAVSALCVAHRAGIVHRDIKPENVMIRPDGYVKVLDFGIAKSGQREAGDGLTSPVWPANTRTRRGAILGTIRYMSPEQARGENVDARSDIWSLGAVLYEMLTDRAPFEGETPSAVRTALLEQEPPSLAESDLPPPLQKLLDKCLQKDPAKRFQASEELLAALRAIGKKSASRRSPVRRTLTVAALVLAGVTAALFMRGLSQKDTRTAPPNESSRKSIAVLPFADLSSEHDQQYFSEGMSEEILNTLAHVKDLKVAGRTSSFSFRGKHKDLRTIAAKLGVANILEGSVRKQARRSALQRSLSRRPMVFIFGRKVDGDLSDVFRLQERIARAITEQLAVVLHGEQQSRLVKTATTSRRPMPFSSKPQLSSIAVIARASPKRLRNCRKRFGWIQTLREGMRDSLLCARSLAATTFSFRKIRAISSRGKRNSR